MAGMRCCDASATSRSRLVSKNGSAPTKSAATCCGASAAKAVSILSSVPPSRTTRLCPSARAASCTSLICTCPTNVFGFTSSAATGAPGTSSCSSPRRFAPRDRGEESGACDVAARPVQAGDQAGLNGISPASKDDGYGRSCCFCGGSGFAQSRDDVHRAVNQFACQRGQTIRVALRPPEIDAHILGLGIAGLAEFLAVLGHHAGGAAAENPDHRNQGLMPTRDKRPRYCRAGGQRYELAALQSIVSHPSSTSVSAHGRILN